MGSSSRKPELRMDVVTERWVIFSPARARRPSDFKSKNPANPNDINNSRGGGGCPFCIGHEHECAPEIFRLPENEDDWKIRVIQNLYPALSRDIDPPVPQNPNNPYPRLSGFGLHDVVIESPLHSLHLSDLSPSQVGDVILAFKKRIQQLMQNESIKYVQVFKNHGASAGASLSHSHSQIMALPIVPPSVTSRLRSMKENYDRIGKCSICEVIQGQGNELLIHESAHFLSVVPFAASFPFEIWIIPRHHASHFHLLDTLMAKDLGGLLKLMLRKMSLQLNDPPFNFMIQTSPLQITDSELLYTHWFLQIVPQLTVAAGFEIATGCYINPVFPEEAAEALRKVNVPE
ncbi:Galactose-1-phosphate uridyl transferase, N-terminal [Dillenia turbinata]|uniref:Galactose-1-phosphate uridyl transferase, N-terminal n=1 Tax=Dillenia turbinata TaxID=194707 RepID=A0AAN8W8Q9_9MAGN